MSMYAMVFGDPNLPSRSGFLLGILGNPDVGRFRDAWLEKDDQGTPQIAVYTRNGGGNRECYHEDGEDSTGCTGCVMNDIDQAAYYIRDQDDSFDCTYATIYFRVPPEHLEGLTPLAGDHIDMDEAWAKAIATITNAKEG